MPSKKDDESGDGYVANGDDRVNLKIDPPDYPLSREAFKRALAIGHGRALIHAENFDLTDYRDDILEAATTNLVCDLYTDGCREWWLARLCKAAGLIDAIIALSPDDCERSRRQRACLLKEFCLAGHTTALPKLYAMCRRSPGADSVEAICELIEADGAKGLVFAARRLGEALLKDPDFEANYWDLEHFDQSYGAGSARAILDEAASTDTAIRHCLEHREACEARQSKKPGPEAIKTVESVLPSIESATRRLGWLRGWGRKASAKDQEEVVKLLKGESRVLVLVNALWCFSHAGLPVYDETLLGLIFHEDEGVRFRAAIMFSHHVEPEVRLAGLALLKRGDLAIGTKLLRLNASAEDSDTILSALMKHPMGDDIHAVLSNLVQLCEESDSVREPLIPLHIYEFSPCMMCRERAIEILLKWNACPQWLLEEAAYDGSDDIRKLIGTGLVFDEAAGLSEGG